jgi:hypothetical protein
MVCASGCNQLTHVRLARVLQEGWERNGAAVCLFCMNESVARSTLMDGLESRALLQASRSILIRISFLLNISNFACVFTSSFKNGRYWSGGIKLLSRFEFPARTGRTLLWRIIAQTVADNLLELLTIIHCQASWCDAFFFPRWKLRPCSKNPLGSAFSLVECPRQAGRLTVDWLARQ